MSFRTNETLSDCLLAIHFSCALVNFCLGSGLSALVVFVTFLSTILASAFYKYAISGEKTTSDDDPLLSDAYDLNSLLENGDSSSDDEMANDAQEIPMNDLRILYDSSADENDIGARFRNCRLPPNDLL